MIRPLLISLVWPKVLGHTQRYRKKGRAQKGRFSKIKKISPRYSSTLHDI